MLKRLYLYLAVGGLLVSYGSGCSRHPPAPEKPDLSPGEAGKAAIAQYDDNGDGRLDDEELEKCPALEEALERVDADNDGMLTAGEIAARVDGWLSSGSTVLSGTVLVKLDEKPLEGATVTFEPEEFLGSAFKPCSGVTSPLGEASLKGPLAAYPGIYVGFYRVKISKNVGGQETIPSRYNSETELGHEAADDIPGVGLIEFHLKSS